MQQPVRDLVVVGAGPSGLATAIAATQADLDYEILEKGVLVNSIFNFPRHMTFFTTPELLEIGGLPFVTPYEKPTQGEALKYYRRVTDTYGLRIALGVQVLGLRREGDGFVLSTRTNGSEGRAAAATLLENAREEREARAGTARSPDPSDEFRHLGRIAHDSLGRDALGDDAKKGAETVFQQPARNVVVATGYYDNPNRLGIPGEDLPHVTHYYTEAHGYYRRRVVVVGAKNSAAIAALEIHRAGAQVTLVHRGDGLSDSTKYWIRPDIENRIKEGAIRALFSTSLVEIRQVSVLVEGPNGPAALEADDVLLMTGYHPDTRLLEDAGVAVDPRTLRPHHDPATFETNVPGLFVCGSLVSGRETGKIFIENGRFHGEAIVRAITARASSRR